MHEEAFRIVEPSGKTYCIYADGRVEGFDPPVTIINRIPDLVRRYASMSKGSPLPTSSETVPRDGAEQDCAARPMRTAVNSSAAAGVK